jgi:CRISPR-associated endonuclease Csn1
MKVMGLDCGIASIGWAVLEVAEDKPEGSIIACGTRMFDSPEEATQSGPKLKSEARRMFRGQRKVIRRRRQRMNAIRQLFKDHGLLETADSESLKRPGVDPWALRTKSLEKSLTPEELAVTLGHIARHRGFRSNAKGAAKENASEDGKMKKAMGESRERLSRYRTYGEMLTQDEAFTGRKRNREGDYSRTPLRDDLAAEVRSIFRSQRRLGSIAASEALEEKFSAIAFTQRGLQDSESLVGPCPFETDQKRAAKRGFSFELFRYLSRLANLEVTEGKTSRRLTHEELTTASNEFGNAKSISFKTLRKLFRLGSSEGFATIKPDEEKRDVVKRTGEESNGASEGTATLKNVLGDAPWNSLKKTPEKLDRIADVISFRSDLTSIRNGLTEIELEPLVLDVLMKAVENGDFEKFTGAGHISAKACRNIISFLQQGLVYSAACEQAHYDHTASRERNAFNVGVTGKAALKEILKREIIDRSLIGSPVARKALIEAVKQVKAIVEVHGIPDQINIEMARDVGKGIDERREIDRGIEKRNKEKDWLRGQFEGDVGRPHNSLEEMLRYELWRQQNHRCVYSDTLILPSQLVASDNSVQIDHILPWSRFGDDSFNNKSLCIAKANQEKRGRTPYEWFSQDKTESQWDSYVASIAALPSLKGYKRRNYTIKGAKELEEKFRSRNLNDTRWTCRLLGEALRQLYKPDEGKRRVFMRPGALTNRLRMAWGLQWIKKDEKGARIPDDRHHALDAIITAATTESQLQRLTRAIQNEEAIGSARDFRDFGPPWPTFRLDAEKAVGSVFVSRAERRRARGKAHDATIRSVSERDGQTCVYQRKPVAKVTLTDLPDIKDADRNAAIIESLRAWIEAGKPVDTRPKSPKGDVISKVRVKVSKKAEVLIRGGAVERGDMVRVDVFRKKTPKGVWQYFLVPIYPHQTVTEEMPPVSAMSAHKPESKWQKIDPTYQFLFAIQPMSFIQLIKSDGEVVEGYYRDVNRNDAGIRVSPHFNNTLYSPKIGSKTLKSLNKYNVDRIGNKTSIESETRTWRGKACT